jgi:hypothetical protein
MLLPAGDLSTVLSTASGGVLVCHCDLLSSRSITVNARESWWFTNLGGRREPDLETLVLIAKSLGTTPNWLLGVDSEGGKATKRSSMADRLSAAAREMTDEELRITALQAEAVARAR